MLVRKINAAFNARLYTPEYEFSIKEKRNFRKQQRIKDIHERDAYFAAMKAYHAFANKLKQAERIAAENGIADVDAGEGQGAQEVFDKRGHNRQGREQEIGQQALF